MADRNGVLPGFPPVCGKAVQLSFDGGRLTSDGGMMAAMIDLFRDSFTQVPSRIVLDIDDTEDEVHGHQQFALFNTHGACPRA